MTVIAMPDSKSFDVEALRREAFVNAKVPVAHELHRGLASGHEASGRGRNLLSLSRGELRLKRVRCDERLKVGSSLEEARVREVELRARRLEDVLRAVVQSEVQRTVGDTSPLQVSIEVNACKLPNKDGKGYSLKLRAMPMSGGEIVLRIVEPSEANA